MTKLKKWFCSPIRRLAGTPALIQRTDSLEVHIRALTEIFYVILGDLMGNWSSEKREQILRITANFKVVQDGLSTIKPKGNPFTTEELGRLQHYTDRARQGQPFQSYEAQDYRELSERAAREYPGQQ